MLLLLPVSPRRERPTWLEALTPAALYGAAAIAVVLPVLAYFASAGALAAMIQQAVVVPMSGALRFTYTRLPR